MKKLLLLSILIIGSFSVRCFSQNIWESTNGPNGVFIQDFLVKDDSILVISCNNGNFLSRDKGQSWYIINEGLPYSDASLDKLTSGPFGIFYGLYGDELFRYDLKNTIWKSTGNKFSYHTTMAETKYHGLFVLDDDKKAIYFSRDSGSTFNLVYQNNDIHFFQSIVCNGNDNNFFITNESGSGNLFKINNDGSGTQVILAGINASFVIWHSSGFLYMDAYPTGLWRMDSMGNNRELLKINKNDSDNQVFKLLVEPNGNLLAITQNGDYESSNLGKDWQVIPRWFGRYLFNEDHVYFAENDIYIFNEYCSLDQLLWSDDFGKTWNSITSKFLFPLVFKVFEDKLGNVFARVCGGAYHLYNNVTKIWERINNPAVTFDLVSTSNGRLIVNTTTNLFSSYDYGKSWDELKINGDSFFVKLVSNNDGLILAFGNHGYRSIDGGLNWDTISNLPSQLLDFYFHPDGTIFGIPNTWSTDKSIYFTIDSGRNWSINSSTFDDIRSFFITESGLIYIEGSTRFNNFGIYTSSDRLNTVDFLSTTSMDVVDLKVDKNGKLYGIQPFSGLCLTSLDSGKTWINFISGLPNYSFSYSLLLDQNQYMYIGLEGHEVYRTIKPVDNPVATIEDKLIGSLTIQPNPIENKMKITISNKNISSGHYKIIDLNGTEKLKGEFNSNNFTVDCSALPNGMAFIQISGKDKIYCSEKIVIVH